MRLTELEDDVTLVNEVVESFDLPRLKKRLSVSESVGPVSITSILSGTMTGLPGGGVSIRLTVRYLLLDRASDFLLLLLRLTVERFLADARLFRCDFASAGIANDPARRAIMKANVRNRASLWGNDIVSPVRYMSKVKAI